VLVACSSLRSETTYTQRLFRWSAPATGDDRSGRSEPMTQTETETMDFQQLIDSLPITGFLAAFAILALLLGEVGFRIGRWWQERSTDEKEGPTSMIVGSLLALMAFLLAITMGMASDRFDARRVLVLAEANTAGTAYLRAGFLPEPASTTTRALIREYVPLRILTDDLTDVQRRIARSVEIQDELWSIAEVLAREFPDSEVLALYITSLNEMIDLHQSRIIAGFHARIPATVLAMLLLCSTLTLGMVGYNAGLTRRRSPLTAVVLVIVLGAVITLVVDLDRPRDGFLKISQQPLIYLQQQIAADGR
jgi:MFS family permease